jgi:hypothetical protein
MTDTPSLDVQAISTAVSATSYERRKALQQSLPQASSFVVDSRGKSGQMRNASCPHDDMKTSRVKGVRRVPADMEQKAPKAVHFSNALRAESSAGMKIKDERFLSPSSAPYTALMSGCISSSSHGRPRHLSSPGYQMMTPAGSGSSTSHGVLNDHEVLNDLDIDVMVADDGGMVIRNGVASPLSPGKWQQQQQQQSIFKGPQHVGKACSSASGLLSMMSRRQNVKDGLPCGTDIKTSTRTTKSEARRLLSFDDRCKNPAAAAAAASGAGGAPLGHVPLSSKTNHVAATATELNPSVDTDNASSLVNMSSHTVRTALLHKTSSSHHSINLGKISADTPRSADVKATANASPKQTRTAIAASTAASAGSCLAVKPPGHVTSHLLPLSSSEPQQPLSVMSVRRRVSERLVCLYKSLQASISRKQQMESTAQQA